MPSEHPDSAVARMAHASAMAVCSGADAGLVAQLRCDHGILLRAADPRATEASTALADALRDMGERKEADALFAEGGARTQPWVTLFDTGSNLLHEGRAAEAAAALRAAMEGAVAKLGEPSLFSAEVRSVLAQALRRTGDGDGALREGRKARDALLLSEGRGSMYLRIAQITVAQCTPLPGGRGEWEEAYRLAMGDPQTDETEVDIKSLTEVSVEDLRSP